jgi:uncharacterized protein with gpF-like domain
MAVSGKSAADFDFTAMPPEEAVKYFERKGFKVGFAWQDVWQQEYARAFTVAKAMTTDLLQDIRTMVDKAIEDGIAFEDFKKNLTPILRARGWWGRQLMVDPLTKEKREVQLGSVRRLQIIYDMNLRMSYSAGSWEQVQRTKALLPYLRYVDPDARPRPEHLDWSGTVLPADDPWWESHYAPNGWNCKCYVDSLGQNDLDRYGYAISPAAPRDEMVTYQNPRTGETTTHPKGIDPGFNYNAGKAGINFAAEQQLAEKLAAADPDVRDAIDKIKS